MHGDKFGCPRRLWPVGTYVDIKGLGEVLFGGRGLGLRLSNRFFTTSEGAGRSVRRPEEPGHRAFVWAGVTPGRMKLRGICGERH